MDCVFIGERKEKKAQTQNLPCQNKIKLEISMKMLKHMAVNLHI
jgi:hypothetical protein